MNTQNNQYISNFFADNANEVKRKTQTLIKKVIGLFAEEKFDDVKILLKDVYPMKYSIQECIGSMEIEESKKDMLFQAGYNSAIIDGMQLYTNEVNIQKEVQKIPTQYKDVLLCTLKKRGTLLHKDLAAELGVSSSGLTDIVKKMNSTSVKIINVEEVSKYKLYSLTPAANRYVVKNMLDMPKSNKTVLVHTVSPAHERINRAEAIEFVACSKVQNFLSLSNYIEAEKKCSCMDWLTKEGQAHKKYKFNGYNHLQGTLRKITTNGIADNYKIYLKL